MANHRCKGQDLLPFNTLSNKKDFKVLPPKPRIFSGLSKFHMNDIYNCIGTLMTINFQVQLCAKKISMMSEIP